MQTPIGAEVLAVMAKAPRYHRWLYDVIAPHLGRRVLEVGAGIGSVSRHLAADSRELVVLTDADPANTRALRARFSGSSRVVVEALALPDHAAANRLAQLGLDTAIAVNVLEHIDDDVGALHSMARIVVPGGRVIVLVPAMPALFGTLDQAVGHQRRYTPALLGDVFRRAGLSLERVAWFNRVGVAGWWLHARVWRSLHIPLPQLRLFDALVPALRWEAFAPLPFGQSLIAVGSRSQPLAQG